jgi:hypothetical protein
VEIDGQDTLKDDKWARLHYLVNDRQQETLKAAYDWGHLVYVLDVRGGDSILFRVPLVYFQQHKDIAVPFSFVWEKNVVAVGPIGGVRHLVYFLLDDLPSDILRRKSRVPTRHNKLLHRTAR